MMHADFELSTPSAFSPLAANPLAGEDLWTLALTRVVDALGGAVILCDSEGRFVASTQGALDVLGAGFGLQAGDELPAPFAEALRECRERLRGMSERASASAVVPLPGASNAVIDLSVAAMGMLHLDWTAVWLRRRELRSDSLHDILKARYAPLRKRDLDIIEHVCRGCANREIASALGIAMSTVKNHLNRIFDIVGVSSRTMLMRTISDIVDGRAS